MVGFVCIAPVIAARLFGGDRVKVTIGNDRDTAAAIESWGATHVDCKVEDVVVDERLEITVQYRLLRTQERRVEQFAQVLSP